MIFHFFRPCTRGNNFQSVNHVPTQTVFPKCKLSRRLTICYSTNPSALRGRHNTRAVLLYSSPSTLRVRVGLSPRFTLEV
jgi:hypothetical protein